MAKRAVAALPISLLAARNIIPSNLIRFPVRRFLDSIRGVDTLIWALVWINVVGLGPFAGVLAIALSDFGAFGKLFSEAIEAADRKQVEGIRASGGNALHEIRFGLMPQVLPVIAGQVLYFIESNTRNKGIRDYWNSLLSKRLRADLDRQQLQTLRLRETETGNRLTIDVGAQRLELASGASEVEREWLARLLAKRYGLTQALPGREVADA